MKAAFWLSRPLTDGNRPSAQWRRGESVLSQRIDFMEFYFPKRVRVEFSVLDQAGELKDLRKKREDLRKKRA